MVGRTRIKLIKIMFTNILQEKSTELLVLQMRGMQTTKGGKKCIKERKTQHTCFHILVIALLLKRNA